MSHLYDVIVVGGGPAGLSGALTLARARRSVLVIDAGEPRNAPAEGVHAFFTRDGTSPAALLAVGRQEVEGYGGQVSSGRVVAAVADGEGFGFVVSLADATSLRARRLLVTTGLVDEVPDVPGVGERWGRDVLHCPYCHGWEVRDRPIGILATGPRAVHQALLFRQWSDDVIFFRHTAAPLTADEEEELAARDIAVVDDRVVGLEIVNDRLTGLRLESGAVVPRAALAVTPRFAARGEVLTSLGLETSEHPLGVGTYVACDRTGLTSVPGVWVAGNVADPMLQVVGSAAAGTLAATAINADLVAEDVRLAVAARRSAAASSVPVS